MRELAAALAAMLPGAQVGWADPVTTPPGDLPPGAVALRRAEFAAGRAAAAMAMAGLGLPVQAVPMGPDRAPVWPGGLVGSITHTRKAALAAVARSGALGIDAEQVGAVTPDLWDTVLHPSERGVVAQDAALATVIFCAKEAVYKAQYPVTGELFGFDRLEITLMETTFAARFTATTGPVAAGTLWHGAHAQSAGHVLAALHHT
jgi:4'-phosphopantetheinyl transferase EntD